jgi:hypothetical protein
MTTTPQIIPISVLRVIPRTELLSVPESVGDGAEVEDVGDGVSWGVGREKAVEARRDSVRAARVNILDFSR